VSGRAAARLAIELGDDVVVFDRRAEAVAPLILEVATAAGEWSFDLLERVDRVVASPGVPEHAPEIRDALVAGIPVISEVELAASVCRAPIVAVTGTNGKTTVTKLIADMVAAGGRKAVAAGNIGTPFSSVAADPWDVAVVEVSSFQLRFIDQFHPVVAVILNIAEDHLDWHGTLDAYVAAKANIFRNQDPSDVLIYGSDSPHAVAAVAGAAARRIAVSGHRVSPDGVGPDGAGNLVTPHGPIPLGTWNDPAFALDIGAAAVVALELGIDVGPVADTVATFEPGPHRRTLVGEWNGVAWVDDSKATNPHAALAAAGAYPSVVLIAGGRNKGLDLRPLVDAPTVRRVVAIGETADDLVAASPGRVTRAGDMPGAVAAAAAAARPGDTVLLAPGCASFDMYESYSARGDAFAAAVEAVHEGDT
jgi:UDP-N-acetylmuramoylalanine--D-glutamate ligase